MGSHAKEDVEYVKSKDRSYLKVLESSFRSTNGDKNSITSQMRRYSSGTLLMIFRDGMQKVYQFRSSFKNIRSCSDLSSSEVCSPLQRLYLKLEYG